MSRFIAKIQIQAIVVVLVCMAVLPCAEAQKALSEGVEELARQIASGVLKEQKPRVAVLPFRELDGRATVLGAYMAEELVTQLFMTGNGLEIVERAMLDKLLGEIKLGETGLIDPETAKEVGKVAGVDAVVTGTITDLQSQVAINCRLIDVETGKIFGAAQVKIVKDDDLKKILATSMPSTGSTEKTKASGKDNPSRPAVQSQVEGFRFETSGCKSRGSSVICELLITNVDEKDQTLMIYGGRQGPRIPGFNVMAKSRIVDERGNEYFAKEISLGNSTGSYPSAILVSGVPLQARLSFEGIQVNPEAIRLLEVSCSTRGNFTVQLRDVPLIR